MIQRQTIDRYHILPMSSLNFSMLITASVSIIMAVCALSCVIIAASLISLSL